MVSGAEFGRQMNAVCLMYFLRQGQRIDQRHYEQQLQAPTWQRLLMWHKAQEMGLYVPVENVKLHALLYTLDLFFVAEAGLLFRAARYIMRLKTSGATLCVLITLVLGIGLRVLNAK